MTWLHNWRLCLLGNYSSLNVTKFINKRNLSRRVKLRSFESEDEQLRVNHAFVNKTVFHSKPKIIFVAGLEGTGHHLLKTAFNTVCTDRKFCYHEPPTLAKMISCGFQGTVLKDGKTLKKLKSSVDGYQGEVLFLNLAGPGIFFLHLFENLSSSTINLHLKTVTSPQH